MRLEQLTLLTFITDNAQMHTILALVVIALSTSSSHANTTDPHSYAGKEEMNGLRLKDYAGFESKWKLVTVRFRRDTAEMRFTYANDLAWNSLKAGGKEYPDGAVFAKISLISKDDPAFVSSAVPSGVRRFQLMVKKSGTFKETDGWGYALFDSKGSTYPEEPKLSAMACHACHRLVPDRGYVFSQPLELSSLNFTSPAVGPAAELAKLQSRVSFEARALSKLPKELRSRLDRKVKRVHLLEGEMRSHLFQGTLDEVKPLLARKAVESGEPAALLSEDGKRFTLVAPRSGGACEKNEAFLSVESTGLGTPTRVLVTKICQLREP